MVFMQKLNLSIVFEHIAGDYKISAYRGCRIRLSRSIIDIFSSKYKRAFYCNCIDSLTIKKYMP